MSRVLLMSRRRAQAMRFNGSESSADGLARVHHAASSPEPKKVEADILDYLARLHDQRALDFDS